VVDPRRLRAGADRVTVVISPANPGTPLGGLPMPTLTVRANGGSRVARFTPPRLASETVLLLAEIYRHGTGWKLRALGQGYADGLAGLARDFGVDVTDDGTRPPPVPVHHFDGFAQEVNQRRSSRGLRAIQPDGRLAAAAQAHAETMAAQGRLDAGGPNGRSVFDQVTAAGYTYLTIDEQLVSGPRSLEEFVRYSLDGQGRSALYNPDFAHVGIGSAKTGGEVYWTALWALPYSPGGLARYAAEVVSLTNGHRTAHRLPALAIDPALTRAAQSYSEDMVARRFYSHTSPEGTQPWDRAATAGSTHRSIGENIACGQRSPAQVVQGWMDSPGHRANILKPEFTHIGIGLRGGGEAGTYWTQLFGGS
jgi:uncharacterized protein YkwD